MDHPLFSRIKDRYPEIFAALEADGVPKTDLALAWDFVTASEQFLTSDLLTMRDKALPVMGDGSDLAYAASEVSSDNPDVLRIMIGTYEAPTFLTAGETDPSVLKRGPDGKPELNGTMTANFAAIVPRCAETAKGPLPVIVFGHGLFGSSAGYIDDGLLQRVANENCVVIVAGDWIGLTERNIGTVALALNRLERAPTVTDKLMQGVINFMTLVRLTKGKLGDDPLFQVDGASIIDPTRIWYFGASLGGIMGGSFMAYEPEVVRGTLGVAGCNWSMCFERSAAWPPLRLALQSAYPGLIGNQEILALFTLVFDRVDGATTAHRVLADPLPGVPPKQIWFYWAIGDSLVANLASEAMARRFGLTLTAPSVVEPYGLPLDTSGEPLSSGATIYDEHPTPLPSDLNLAPLEENGTHGNVHERNAILSTIKHFFETGELVNGCVLDGVPVACDCSTGACEHFVE